ncbi:MAG: hypothetical protein L6Q75_03835 [Burkholderiaceae bacterium]|nr:hypothetical protein [Burkholderiaceae bacterium]
MAALYLLDTNILIAALKGHPAVRARLESTPLETLWLAAGRRRGYEQAIPQSAEAWSPSRAAMLRLGNGGSESLPVQEQRFDS